MTLAIFDMDETLIGADCCSEWARFMVKNKIVTTDDFLQREEQLMEDYSAGVLDMSAYVEFLLEPVRQWPYERLCELSQKFCDTHMVKTIYNDARRTVSTHIADGHTPIVISASPAFIVAPIARELGIEHVIAIEIAVDEGLVVGTSQGILSYREGKISRLEAWMTQYERIIEGAYFYSDSHNDLPLLSRVSNPRTVNPDQTLSQHAIAQNWDILSWSNTAQP